MENRPFFRLRFFIMTDGMGWDGMVGPLFFCPYLAKYYIIFRNCFSSLKYIILDIILNIRRKKIGMFFFSKYFAKIKNDLFFENFYKDFPNFSKTTLYFFLIVFGPLRRVNDISFRIFGNRNWKFFLFQNISQLFFLLRKKRAV